MRKFFLVVLLCLFPILAGCGGSKPKDLIVGKWESTDPKDKGQVLEFTSDGKMVLPKAPDMPPNMKMDAKYKFVSDDEMEVTMTIDIPGVTKGPDTKTEKVKVKIEKDEMTMTDSKGKVDKAKRVK